MGCQVKAVLVGMWKVLTGVVLVKNRLVWKPEVAQAAKHEHFPIRERIQRSKNRWTQKILTEALLLWWPILNKRKECNKLITIQSNYMRKGQKMRVFTERFESFVSHWWLPQTKRTPPLSLWWAWILSTINSPQVGTCTNSVALVVDSRRPAQWHHGCLQAWCTIPLVLPKR